MRKEKALLISPYPFYPPDGGGKIRIYNNVKSLSKLYDLHILIPTPSSNRDIKGLKFLSKSYNIYSINIKHFLDSFPLTKNFYFLLRSIFAKYPISGIYEFYSNPQVIKLIKSDFSFIQLEHSWWYHSILKKRKGKLIIIEHNYEYEYWKELGRSLLKQKKYVTGLKYIIGSLKILQQEQEALKDADLILTVSERETNILKKFALKGNIYTVPSGIDTTLYTNYSLDVKRQDDYIYLIYVGSLNTPQTAEGAIFFIKEIWPLLKQSPFKYKLYLVGRDPVRELEKLASEDQNIILTGFVEDVRLYIAKSHIYIVPLRYGSGIRLKIMEAMAMGKPIVSTKKGAEGLNLHNCGLIIADRPDDFAKAIVKLSKDDNLREKFGRINIKYAQEHFDWENIFVKKALPLYQRIIAYE